MNNVAEEEMIRLQDEAKQRVMSMREKSKFVREDMNRNMGINGIAENMTLRDYPEKVRNIKMPVEINDGGKQGTSENESEQKQRKDYKNLSADSGDFMSDLSAGDIERMFILSMCLLLKNEKVDSSVIFALLYIIS